MKKIFVMILIGALSVGLLGCQKQPENPASHLEETEPEEAAQVGDADDNVETVSTESDEATLDTVPYESSNICFEYPNTWEMQELQHEDGKVISFLNQDGEKVLWMERGEAWRVNPEMTEADCKVLLSETYKEVEIIELSKADIDGYEAQVLTFSYNADGAQKTIKRYTAIVGYAFCEINMSSALSEEEMSSVVDSIDFVSSEEKKDDEVQMLQQKMEEFCQTYFKGDVAAVKEYLSVSFTGKAEVYADLSKEKITDIREVTGLSDVNELIESEEYVLSIPFVVPGEDSMTYLTVSFISEDGEWMVSSYGIEK